MNSMTSFLPFLNQLADAAAEAIMPHFRTGMTVEDKGSELFDPVTVADREAEAAMRRLIGVTFPEHGIIGEEYGTEHEGRDFVWVLDPIDGTRSFIAGIPLWGTLIGLLHEGKPVLGMMAQPFTGERFAGDGGKAWHRGPGGERRLSVRRCAALGSATLLTTSPSLFSDSERAAYQEVEAAARLARYGTDCYAYCMVAAGQADLVVEAGLQIYDIAALIPIIEGAGGQVSNWSGGSDLDSGRVVASGDAGLHRSALEILSRI